MCLQELTSGLPTLLLTLAPTPSSVHLLNTAFDIVLDTPIVENRQPRFCGRKLWSGCDLTVATVPSIITDCKMI